MSAKGQGSFWALITSLSISQFALVVVGILILLVIGVVFFDIRVIGSWAAFVVAG